MTKEEFETVHVGDVVRNDLNQCVLVVLNDGNPRDATVQIQMHELTARYQIFTLLFRRNNATS